MIHTKICDCCGNKLYFDDRKITTIPLLTGCFPTFFMPIEYEKDSSFFKACDKNNSRALFDVGYTRKFISGLIGKSERAVGNWIELDFDMVYKYRYSKEIDTLTLNIGESFMISEAMVRNSRLFVIDLDNYYRHFMITSAKWVREEKW